MNVTKIGKSTKIEAESELTIYSVNNFVYKSMFIISSKDSIDNYEEMTVEEAAERAYSDRAEAEERRRKEEENRSKDEDFQENGEL